MHSSGRVKPQDVIAERFGIDALNYEVPRSARKLSHNLGELAIVAFAVLLATGLALELSYRPDPVAAHRITTDFANGNGLAAFAYALHHWAAMAMLALLALHVARVVVSGAYKGGREGTWTLGVLMLLTCGALYFTGTTLRWDQNSYEAVQHSASVAATVGAGGLVHSGTDAVVLARMHALHISLLVIGLLSIMFVHLLLVKRHGIAPSPFRHPPELTKTEPFLVNRRRSAGFALLLMAALLALSVLAPPEAGPQPDPALDVTKPAAPFLWLNALGRWFGTWAILAGVALLAAVLLALPLVDRGRSMHPRDRLWVVVPAAVAGSAIVAASVWAAVTPL